MSFLFIKYVNKSLHLCFPWYFLLFAFDISDENFMLWSLGILFECRADVRKPRGYHHFFFFYYITISI